MTPTRILIVYEFFPPAKHAGGIVQSLVGLTQNLTQGIEWWVYTGAYELNEKEPMQGLACNQWTGASPRVFYVTRNNANAQTFRQIVDQVQPHWVYCTGFMSVPFFLKPLQVLQEKAYQHIPLLVAPRGMLQEGALQQKKLKKRLFLFWLQRKKLLLQAQWHITHVSELKNIHRFFPKTGAIYLLPNISRQPLQQLPENGKPKLPGQLDLLYASLVTPKKNLLRLVQALAFCKTQIRLQVHGAVKEQNYLQEVTAAIAQLPDHVQVKVHGPYGPEDLPNLLEQADAFVLLSQAENFSHAIFEALGQGLPVISSHFTSWNHLTQDNAGWNLDIDNPQTIAQALDQLAAFSNNQWQVMRQGAHARALAYLAENPWQKAYLNLFKPDHSTCTL